MKAALRIKRKRLVGTPSPPQGAEAARPLWSGGEHDSHRSNKPKPSPSLTWLRAAAEKKTGLPLTHRLLKNLTARRTSLCFDSRATYCCCDTLLTRLGIARYFVAEWSPVRIIKTPTPILFCDNPSIHIRKYEGDAAQGIALPRDRH